MAKEEELRPYEGGGAGGKLRTSRFSRRSSTPYDRPQTGRHAPAAVRAAVAAADSRRSGNTWFSRIVDPASRLITESAMKWFSSVFKKNYPAITSGADDVEEVQEDSLQEVPEEALENAKVIGQDQDATPANKQRSEPEFTEVEQLLKNKTFSREEFNRLTELLQSRIVDRSSVLKDFKEQSGEELHGGAEPSNAVNAEAQRWRAERQKAREEKEDSVRHNGLFANAPTSAVLQNLPDEVGSSPADIAKAFMGVRPYRASSLALQGRPFRDENTPSKPNGLSLVPRTEGWLVGGGQAEDKFKTPQTARMQSRIQNLSRTPYARNVHQQAPAERIGNGFPISTPVSQWTPIQSPITGGRQTLKRRSSVLDDDFTSGRSIRRTRHKPIFVTQIRNPDPSGSTSNQLIPFLSPRDDGERTVLDSVKKPTEFERQNAFHSREVTRKELCAGSCIPPQSSETARKILEHLDRMVPSPKEISAEAQLAIARDKSPSQLTVSMLNGPARRSTESIDATSLFDKYSPSSVVQKNNHLTGQGASSAEQKYGGKGKAPLFNPVTTSVEEPTSSGIGDVSSLITDASPARTDAKSLILDSSNLPEKSKGFRMSALEESDDEGHASRNAGMLPHAQTGKVPSFTSDGNGNNSIISGGDKQITSATVLQTRSGAYLGTSTTSVSIDSSRNNSSGFTFPVTPSNSNFAEPPPTPTVMPSPSGKGNTQPMTANSTPTYNFGSASPSKGPVFSFSTSGSTDVDTTKPKFDFKFESKPESSFSTAVAAAASAPTCVSESLASIFKGTSTTGLSGSSPSFSSSSSIFSTSTTVATPPAVFPLFGGAVSTTNSMDSVPFSLPGKSSSAATTVKMDSKLRSPDTIPQVEASSVVAEDQSIKISTSGESFTIKSQNEPKTSGVSPSSPVGAINGTSITLSSTSAISPSTSSPFPNTQSAFAGSLFGQATSSATAATPASFVFGSSANAPSLSSSVLSASSCSSSSVCGNTSPYLFGSTLSASASSASGNLFGLTTPNSSSSSSLSSSSLSNSSTSAQFASSTGPASGSGTTLTFGAGSNPSVGSTGTSNFSGSSSTSFGLGSTSQFGSNMSSSFGLNNTPQFGSNSSPSFGLNTTPQFGSSTSSTFGLANSLHSSASTAPSFGSSVTFGSNTTSSFTTGSTPSFGSGSTPPFGSGSTPPFGSGSTPSFGAGSTFGSSSSPTFGGSSTSFGSASAPSFGGSNVSFGAASTPAFGGSSASYGPAASAPLFGSNSTPSFGLGQSFGASSVTSSQSTLPSFGSGFGGTASLPSTGFSFGGSMAASSGSFTFGGAGSTPSGTTFPFGSTSTTPSTFTFASKDSSSMPQPQPLFGLTNSNSAFGAAPSPTSPADQMEDSMAEDPAQVSSPAPPVFGGQSASLASSFVFGSQPTVPSPGQSVFQFGAQPGPAAANPFAPNPQSTFTPAGGGGGLEFSGGFSLGAGGDRNNRKFIKAKRDKTRRK